MHLHPILRAAAVLLLLPLAACFRVDSADLQLRVPGLATERDLVLVTNAAQHELMGEYPDPAHVCEMDLGRSLLIYHAGSELREARHVRQLLSALALAGYPGTVQSITFNPTPPLRVADRPDPIVVWPDRHTLVVQIPELKRNLDGNRVADALAYGRAGGRLERLRVDPVARTVQIAQQNRRVAARGNYAFAVATAGYGVEGWGDGQPPADPPARGWWPCEG